MRFLLLLGVGVLLAAAQTPRPVIAVGGISHESNSFNPAKTTLADFGRRTLSKASFQEAVSGHDILAGVVEGARQFGLDLYFTTSAGASPKGPVTEEAFETLSSELVKNLKAAPSLDGVILNLHGAMVAERYPHGDAETVRRVREAVGPRAPIVVTHDFHANVCQQIVDQSTALITYKENPHIDTRERGLQAARIMAGIVSGKVKPVQALVKPPMLYNIVYQHTRRPPLLPIVEETRRLEQNPKILAASVAGGYQYADVEAMGESVILVTE